MVAFALDVGASEDIPRDQVEAARRHVEALGSYTDAPLSVRLTLRRGGRGDSAFVADASTVFDGRVLAAHAAGPSAVVAAETVAKRLRRQLRRVVGADVAQRNEPAVIGNALSDLVGEPGHRPEARVKPPEEREIVHRRTYADHPESTLEAISDLIDLDEEFHLFVHVRTREDVVVHHRDDGRIGLLHPRGSILADEADELVAPEPSRYSEPLPLDVARAEMDLVEHRFLYFSDAADGRGKVLYLRHDGDYGLVEPR
jgi:ribosome-associated translation inhibitor RaiA